MADIDGQTRPSSPLFPCVQKEETKEATGHKKANKPSYAQDPFFIFFRSKARGGDERLKEYDCHSFTVLSHIPNNSSTFPPPTPETPPGFEPAKTGLEQAVASVMLPINSFENGFPKQISTKQF